MAHTDMSLTVEPLSEAHIKRQPVGSSIAKRKDNGTEPRRTGHPMTSPALEAAMAIRLER